MLDNQVVVSSGEDVGVVSVESQAENIAGMFFVHGARLTQLGHHLLVDVPQENALIVAPWNG